MTLVNTETGEIVETTYAEVKASIAKAKASLEEAAEQIVWQIERQAWTVLGYSDWNQMREAEYGGAAFMVPRAERPELLARMRHSGLTQQEIADTAGVSVGNESDVIDYLLGAVAGLVDANEWDAAMARAFTNARQRVAS